MNKLARLRTNLRVLDRVERRDEARELRRLTDEAISLAALIGGLDSGLLSEDAKRHRDAALILFGEVIWELRLGARS